VRLTPPDLHGDGFDGEVDVVAVEGELWLDREPAGREQLEKFGLALADHATAAGGDAEGAMLAVSRSGRVRPEIAPRGRVRRGGKSAALGYGQPGHPESVRLAGGTNWQIKFTEPPDDEGTADPKRGGDGEDAATLVVELTEVVDVDVEPGRHRVYNLDTGWGWFIGNSLVVGNCRCTTLFEEFA
jgi:hypothetical protein